MNAIATAVLVGGAAFFVVYTAFGGDVVKAAGAGLLLAILADAVRDAWQAARDRRTAYDRWRRTAYDRWREWRDG